MGQGDDTVITKVVFDHDLHWSLKLGTMLLLWTGLHRF